jgi:multiple sugar transport system ATP-binding protein
MNLDRLPFDGTAARAGEVGIPLPGAAAAAARQAGLSEVVLGLRPESLSLALDGGGDGATRLSGAVHLVEDTGADAWVHVDAPGGSSALRLVAQADARRLPAVGDRIVLAIRVGEAHVFDPATGERLGD